MPRQAVHGWVKPTSRIENLVLGLFSDLFHPGFRTFREDFLSWCVPGRQTVNHLHDLMRAGDCPLPPPGGQSWSSRLINLFKKHSHRKSPSTKFGLRRRGQKIYRTALDRKWPKAVSYVPISTCQKNGQIQLDFLGR